MASAGVSSPLVVGHGTSSYKAGAERGTVALTEPARSESHVVVESTQSDSVTPGTKSAVLECHDSRVTEYDESATKCDESLLTECSESAAGACSGSGAGGDESSVTVCDESSVRVCDESSVTVCDESAPAVHLCCQCGAPARYTCPGCLQRTCSLPCVRQHKQLTGCSGQRQKLRYKPLSQFTDLDLLSDYRLLEDVGRRTEALRRGRPPGGGYGQQRRLRPSQHRLRRAAKRRQVRLHFLPESFERSRLNSSHCRAGGLYWRLEWRLPLAGDLTLVSEAVSDTSGVGQALREALAQCDEVDEQYRAAAELRRLRVFLVVERAVEGGRYVELPPGRSLQACLAGRALVEHPLLVVTTEDHADLYRQDVVRESFLAASRRQERSQRSRRRRESRRRGEDVQEEVSGQLPRPRLDAVPVVSCPRASVPAAGPTAAETLTDRAASPPAAPPAFGLFGATDSDPAE